MIKTAIVLVLAIIAQVAGNILLSKGMHSGDGLDVTASILHTASSPLIWFGTLLLATFFALHSAAMSWADLSFILPATSFGYVLNVACAKIFLHETVSGKRWAGAVMICVGVAFVSRSEVKTYEVPETAMGGKG